MPNYRRMYVPGGTYFFTVVTYGRRPLFTDPKARNSLGTAFAVISRTRPFTTVAWVLLPDHFHCVWSLPKGDSDYSNRWRLIKRRVTQSLTLQYSRPIWQPRFWEHTVRDEDDLYRCVHYIHFNPVKHGLVQAAEEWRFSSYRRFLTETELYANSALPADIDLGDVE